MKSAKDILKAMHEKLIADYPKENWESWKLIESSPYLSYYLEAMEEYAQQSQPSGMRWVVPKTFNVRIKANVDKAALESGLWDKLLYASKNHEEYKGLKNKFIQAIGNIAPEDLFKPANESSPAGAADVQDKGYSRNDSTKKMLIELLRPFFHLPYAVKSRVVKSQINDLIEQCRNNATPAKTILYNIELPSNFHSLSHLIDYVALNFIVREQKDYTIMWNDGDENALLTTEEVINDYFKQYPTSTLPSKSDQTDNNLKG